MKTKYLPNKRICLFAKILRARTVITDSRNWLQLYFIYLFYQDYNSSPQNTYNNSNQKNYPLKIVLVLHMIFIISSMTKLET